MPVEIKRLYNDGTILRDVDFMILGEIPLLPIDLDTSGPALGLTHQ